VPRFPSQLYEATLEGIVLFTIVWIFSSRPRPRYAVAGLFAICYGLARILVEFVREPDIGIGYLAFGWLTMGQVLSLPLLLAGVILMWLAYTRQEPSGNFKSPQ
jgi:phosphatidylglycerol:prolipoprotein diacylglycerol transferase